VIVIYWAILKWIEWFEMLSEKKDHSGGPRSSGESFVWFDNFYDNSHQSPSNPNQGDDYDTDSSFDSPDW